MISRIDRRLAIWPLQAAVALASLSSAGACGDTRRTSSDPIELSDPVRMFGGEHPLYRVRDVALGKEHVLVLTEPSPVVHRFAIRSPDEYSAWGDDGQGPDGFENPQAIDVSGGEVFTLDMLPGGSTITTYSTGGELRRSVRIEDVQLVSAFDVAGPAIVVEGGEFGSDERVLSRVRPDATTRVISYTDHAPKVRLTPGAGPINAYTVPTPLVARPLWALLSGSGVAFWSGNGSTIAILSLSGDSIGSMPLPDHRLPVDPADREVWLDRQFPLNAELFGIRNPYVALREAARNTLEFPDHFPFASRLEPGPDGALWVLRAEKSDGEIWSLVDERGTWITLSLPPGRRAMAFGREHVAALAVDDDGVETVELYRLPER